MKQMEYTIKVVTDHPVEAQEIEDAIGASVASAKATCTNYRVLPAKKPAKAEGPVRS